MNEVVVGCQSLVVSDELLAVSINGRGDCWIPAPRGYAHVLEKRCAPIDRLGEKDIDQPVLGIEACIKEGDADNAIGRNCHLWLELIGAILQGIIVHPDG